MNVTQIDSYESVLKSCRDVNGRDWTAIRSFKLGQDAFLLAVDPIKLSTEILRGTCLRCEPATDKSLEHQRFISAVLRLTDAPWPTLNDGLRSAEESHSGSFVTGDLCPTKKPLDRTFFNDLHVLQAPVPIAISVSGAWMRAHKTDLDWLKERVSAGDLQITWVNHSNTHPFTPDASNEENFLLKPGLNFEREILETEKLLIKNGLTPSVFFRFPGLASNQKLMIELRQKHLIPLGADAWLAKSQRPKNGSVILIHPNGNEPYGLVRFSNLLRETKLPLPLLPLTEAPHH